MTPDELRQSREALGLSQQGLADELRMGSQGHRRIREMEQGQRDVSGPVESAVRLLLKQEQWKQEIEEMRLNHLDDFWEED